MRALSRILLTEGLGKRAHPWAAVDLGCRLPLGSERQSQFAAKLAKGMMERLGSTSGLYQMFGELQDLYVFDDGCLRRYEEVRATLAFAKALPTAC